jgi:hypothetical protein
MLTATIEKNPQRESKTRSDHCVSTTRKIASTTRTKRTKGTTMRSPNRRDLDLIPNISLRDTACGVLHCVWLNEKLSSGRLLRSKHTPFDVKGRSRRPSASATSWATTVEECDPDPIGPEDFFTEPYFEPKDVFARAGDCPQGLIRPDA